MAFSYEISYATMQCLYAAVFYMLQTHLFLHRKSRVKATQTHVVQCTLCTHAKKTGKKYPSYDPPLNNRINSGLTSACLCSTHSQNYTCRFFSLALECFPLTMMMITVENCVSNALTMFGAFFLHPTHVSACFPSVLFLVCKHFLHQVFINHFYWNEWTKKK